MRADVVEHLRCPVCGSALRTAGTALRCPAEHSFDIARQGYVDLSAGKVTHAGDTLEMISARQALLAAGHFRVLTEALVDTVGDHPPRLSHRKRLDLQSAPNPPQLMVDIGAGTGHHLAALLAARPHDVGLAVDVSKPALRRAARAHPRIGAIRADVWRGLPVADAAAAAVVNVF